MTHFLRSKMVERPLIRAKQTRNVVLAIMLQCASVLKIDGKSMGGDMLALTLETVAVSCAAEGMAAGKAVVEVPSE
jgi:hypothetical protein